MTVMRFKSISSWSLILVAVVVLTSCDSGFDSLNTDETSLTSVEPALQVNTAIVNSGLNFSNLLCESTVVRQGVAPFTGVLTCANLNQDNKGQTSTNWNRYYGTNGIRELTDAVHNSVPDENVHHIARIWRAYDFMVLTDSYGDVPYSQAGVAFREGVAFPVYDTQESIYTGPNGILAELDAAAGALNTSQPADTRILFYGGDPAQWKRLGYSLLLRAAMRLSEVRPDLAEEYAGRAVAGGLMQSNDDNAVIRHTSDYRNPVGTQLTGGESPNYYLDEVFVNHLVDTDDPRLASIAVRYPAAESGSHQTRDAADRSPDNQVGMPQGYDSNTIVPVAEAAGLPSFFAYSQIDRTRMGSAEAPTFLVTYAQTLLLQAEAVARGWVQGDASALYEAGIEAHMKQLAEYGADTAVDQSDIDAYVQANPLQAGSELEQIHTQYWMASFMNGPEAWAHFRRTGYPDVPPNPLSGELTRERFMTRFTYPDSEYSVNSANLGEAVGRQGSDDLDTRVWWDVQ